MTSLVEVTVAAMGCASRTPRPAHCMMFSSSSHIAAHSASTCSGSHSAGLTHGRSRNAFQYSILFPTRIRALGNWSMVDHRPEVGLLPSTIHQPMPARPHTDTRDAAHPVGYWADPGSRVMVRPSEVLTMRVCEV